MRRYQRGAVLIQTLFFVMIIAIVATTVGVRLFFSLQQYNTYQEIEKAYLAAPFARHWAENILKKPAAMPAHNPVATYTGNLANSTPSIQMTAQLFDLQGKFNLNNLVDTAYQPVFVRLLQILMPEISPLQANEVTQNIVNWLSLGQANNQLKAPQTELKNKMRRWLLSPSELKLIPSINEVLYTKLIPHVSVLPEVTPININTAALPLIQAVIENITSEQAQKLLSSRQEKTFEKLDEISKQIPTLKPSPSGWKLLSVNSNYFLVHANLTIANQILTVLTVIKKPTAQQTGKSNGPVEVIQQTLGIL